MESTRPTPVDLKKFSTGDSRTSDMEELGTPVTTSKGSDGTSCDLYLLYVRGYGTASKVPIAVAEGAADVFTLGLAEIILSPTEAVTKNEKRPVWFCYQNDTLSSVTIKSAEAEKSMTSTPSPSPESASSPAVSIVSTPATHEKPAPTNVATPVPSAPASATPTATAPIGEHVH